MSKSLLSTAEAFDRIDVGNTTGYSLLKSGQLRSVKIGKRRLIPEDAISDFIASLEAQQDPKNAA